MDGLLVFENIIVVPELCRDEIMSKLHESHQGYSKCKDKANSCVWWPGLAKQLKEMVGYCRTCLENRPAQPLRPTVLPERLGADL